MSRLAMLAPAALLLAFPASAQDKAAQVDRIFAFATSETPGCAVGVSQNGKVVVNRAYGLADVERRRPLTTSSKFDIGSTQKQFTAAAVLLLVQDGRLALTDDVRKYVPELPDYGRKVTIDHLITNTSGIRDWPPLLEFAEPGVDVMTLILRQRSLNFTPGDEWSYSSSGFELAKLIVSRVSGMPFGEFARRRLFEPLSMASTEYAADIMKAAGDHALAYRKEDGEWKPDMRLGNERADGGVMTTAGDLLAWNDALTTGRLGKLVTEKIQEPVRLNNGRTLRYARALMLDSIPGGRLIYHDGGSGGFGTWLGRFTEEGVSLVVMCNFEPVSVGPLVTAVADLFLPPVDPNGQPPGPVAAPGVDVSGRAGLYLGVRTGEPMRLAASRGRLAIVGGLPLVAVSAERFRPRRGDLFYRSQDDFELTFRSNDEFEYRSMEGETSRYRRAQPYVPPPADLRGVEGRYFSDEIGTSIDIQVGQAGLVLRFERSPDRPLELEAVAGDAFVQNSGILRFHRDRSGRVTGFDLRNGSVRDLRYVRAGERADHGPGVPVTKDATPNVPAPRLEGLVGVYELAPGRLLTVTLESGRLHGQTSSGGAKLPLSHVSGATFTTEGRPITLTFTLGADGAATGLVMLLNGTESAMKKVK